MGAKSNLRVPISVPYHPSSRDFHGIVDTIPIKITATTGAKRIILAEHFPPCHRIVNQNIQITGTL